MAVFYLKYQCCMSKLQKGCDPRSLSYHQPQQCTQVLPQAFWTVRAAENGHKTLLKELLAGGIDLNPIDLNVDGTRELLSYLDANFPVFTTCRRGRSCPGGEDIDQRTGESYQLRPYYCWSHRTIKSRQQRQQRKRVHITRGDGSKIAESASASGACYSVGNDIYLWRRKSLMTYVTDISEESGKQSLSRLKHGHKAITWCSQKLEHERTRREEEVKSRRIETVFATVLVRHGPCSNTQQSCGSSTDLSHWGTVSYTCGKRSYGNPSVYSDNPPA